jgi:flagellar biosynthesis/type III secretory pathway protein FliH
MGFADDLGRGIPQSEYKRFIEKEAKEMWEELDRSTTLSADKPFDQWSERAQDNLITDLRAVCDGCQRTAMGRLDNAIKAEIDHICKGDRVSREEYLRQIEKSAYIGYQDGVKKGYEMGAAQMQARLEVAACKRAGQLGIWWFLVGAAVTALLSFGLRN